MRWKSITEENRVVAHKLWACNEIRLPSWKKSAVTHSLLELWWDGLANICMVTHPLLVIQWHVVELSGKCLHSQSEVGHGMNFDCRWKGHYHSLPVGHGIGWDDTAWKGMLLTIYWSCHNTAWKNTKVVSLTCCWSWDVWWNNLTEWKEMWLTS